MRKCCSTYLIIVSSSPLPINNTTGTSNNRAPSDEKWHRGEIMSLDQQAEVPAGYFERTLMTRDTNPLEPKVNEFKFYERGIGPVQAVAVSGGSDREELLSYRAG